MRLIVEVTETFESQLKTGIQRVVRRVCKELYTEANIGSKPTFVVSSRLNRNEAQILSTEFFGIPSIETQNNVSSVWNSRTYRFLSQTWIWLSKTFLSNILETTQVKRLAEYFVTLIHKREVRKRPPSQICDFGSQDVLLLIDAFWGNEKGLNLARNAKEKGAKIILLLNDVFPVSHPELCDRDLVERFRIMAAEALEMADHILYPSFVTRDEISRHMGDVFSRTPHSKLPYGHDGIQRGCTAHDSVKPLRIKNSICVVGTVEPRKNYETIFNWFISHERFSTKLTFIGKAGWLTEDLQAKLRLEGKMNPNFTWHESADDLLLSYEMQRHEVGIMASFAEGFGLPVVEMDQSGLRLVLSDIPIFREVAGQAAKYFDPKSVDDLDKAIRKARLERAGNRIPYVSWKDTSMEIGKIAESLCLSKSGDSSPVDKN